MRFDFPAAPLLLGFVLGPLIEENFRRALVLSRGRLEVFIDRPVSAVFLGLTLLVLLASIPQVRALVGLLVRGLKTRAINE